MTSRFARIKKEAPEDLRLYIAITEEEWQEIKACANREGKTQIFLESKDHDTIGIDVRFFTWELK